MTPAARQWFYLVLGTVGLAGSLVTAQVIVARQGWRLDLTPSKRYQLSDYARRALADLDEDVRVVAFLRSGDKRNRDIEDLLWRASLASDRLRYQVVDVNRNPALAREYGVDAYGSIVVESGGRRRAFPNPTEDLLVSAIVQVTRPGTRRLLFLTGHGERDLRTPEDRQGYSSARVTLMADRYQISEAGLLAADSIPGDTSVLIIAGPRSDLLTGELLRLDEYLRAGGSALVMLDPGNAPGLAALLRRYGVVVQPEIVLDRENRLFAGDYLTMLVPGRSQGHPVSASLESPVLMSQARPVSVEKSENAVAAIAILETASDSWATADQRVLRTGAADFVEGRDRRGPLPVGVSVLVRGSEGRVGRLIVYGDADFASNSFLGYLGNRDLLLNSVNWLAGEQTLMGTRQPSKEPGINQFFVSARQGRLAFWLGTVVEPVIVLLIGVVVVIRRRLNG